MRRPTANGCTEGSRSDAFHQPGGVIGGKASIRERSASSRSAGRACRVQWMRRLARVLTRRQYYNVFSEVYFRPLAWALCPTIGEQEPGRLHS
jgi:hypothetical protein